MYTDTDYICECDFIGPRQAYVVTGRDGSTATCCYCPDCHELAVSDWTGETADVRPVDPD
jgi:hypothetical protein